MFVGSHASCQFFAHNRTRADFLCGFCFLAQGEKDEVVSGSLPRLRLVPLVSLPPSGCFGPLEDDEEARASLNWGWSRGWAHYQLNCVRENARAKHSLAASTAAIVLFWFLAQHSSKKLEQC